MELLLNLAWLLLALPAYMLWRDSRATHSGRRFTAFQCLLALACLLVILFPVVSASDDLQAMRAEMEESPTSKRSVGQSTGEKLSGYRSQSQPALAVVAHLSCILEHGCNSVEADPISTPTSTAIARSVRGPPSSLIG